MKKKSLILMLILTVITYSNNMKKEWSDVSKSLNNCEIFEKGNKNCKIISNEKELKNINENKLKDLKREEFELNLVQGNQKGKLRVEKAGYGYTLNNKNFENSKTVIYLKQMKSNYCYEIREIDNKINALKFLNIENTQKYYSNELCKLPLKNFININKNEKNLFQKFIIEDGKNVALEIHTINNNGKKIVKKYTKKYSNKIGDLIKKIDNNKEEGYYGIPLLRDEFSIYTKNKIIKSAPATWTEDEQQLIRTLVNLFKKEYEPILKVEQKIEKTNVEMKIKF